VRATFKYQAPGTCEPMEELNYLAILP